MSEIDALEKGDTFRVDCHDKALTVHSTADFIGPIVLDAYDEDGAQWPIALVDGSYYLGWSQVTPKWDQSRMKVIEEVKTDVQ